MINETLSKFYKNTFSDCLSDKYTRVSEDDSTLGYSIDLDDIHIRPTKDKKPLSN